MANKHATLTSLFTDIANAIRAKTGEAGTIVADNFPSAVASIPEAAPYTFLQLITQSTNNDMTVQLDASKDYVILCFRAVNVNTLVYRIITFIDGVETIVADTTENMIAQITMSSDGVLTIPRGLGYKAFCFVFGPA